MRRTKVACCLVPVLVTQGLTGLTESATSQKIANTWLLPESTARRPHMSWSRGALVVAYLFPLALPRIAVGQARARLIDDSLRASVDRIFAAEDHANTPGCALGVARDAEGGYERGY